MPEKVVLKKYANRRLYDTEKRDLCELEPGRRTGETGAGDRNQR